MDEAVQARGAVGMRDLDVEEEVLAARSEE